MKTFSLFAAAALVAALGACATVNTKDTTANPGAVSGKSDCSSSCGDNAAPGAVSGKSDSCGTKTDCSSKSSCGGEASMGAVSGKSDSCGSKASCCPMSKSST
ncbi:MAG: hypothetical protein FJ257_00860 [Phycisphaerae bacterium]|nr:hypothetical protein [Phycisphaerae bacterium]